MQGVIRMQAAAAVLGGFVWLCGITAAHAVGPKGNRAGTPPPAPPAPPAPPTPLAPLNPVARISPTPPVPPRPPVPPSAALYYRLPPTAWYGVSLRCNDCSIRHGDDGGPMEWRFDSEPEILDVEPDSPADQAGVRSGDVLTHIDGVKIVSREGGRRFGRVKPGDLVKWKLERRGKSHVVTIKAAEPPEDFHFDFDTEALHNAQEEVQRAIEQLERDGERWQLDARRENDARLRAQIDAEIRRSRQATQRQLEQVRRQLDRTLRRNQVFTFVSPDSLVPLAPDEHGVVVLPERPKRVRYQGQIGDSHVEVRGTSRVVVTEDDGKLVIDTPDATIRVEKAAPPKN